jgi:hypothetical protein
MGFSLTSLNPLYRPLQKMATVNAPPPRNFQSEINQILGMSDELYGDAAQWSPKYTDLAVSNAGRASAGMAGAYDTAAKSAGQTNSDLLSQFGSQYVGQLRGLNPSQTQLYDLLSKSATEGLQAGGRMTADQQFNVASPVRSSWAARGFSADALPGQLEEAVAMARAGDNVLGQRQQTAMGVAGLGNQFYTQPAAGMALSSGGADGTSLLGMGSGMSANTTNTMDQLGAYGSDVFNTNYNADAAARIATANNKTGMFSSAMSY